MIDEDVLYVPALKAKGGEFGALAALSAQAKSRILPLLDVLPIPIDFQTNAPKKTLDKHLDWIVQKTVKAWGTDQELLVDLFDLPLSDRTPAGKHPLTHLFSSLNSSRVKATPVVGLERDDPYNVATKQAVANASGAVAIRLLLEDIALPANATSPLSKLVSRLGAIPESSYLLLDFRSLRDADLATAVQRALVSLRSFSRVAKWKRTAVLGSGMPDTLRGIKTRTQAVVHRTELELWEKISAGFDGPAPLFGDYGVLNPEFMEPMDPRKIKPSAKIRYTLEKSWLIVKGSSFRDDPGQFRSMAALVARQKTYCGQDFSWGDKYIAECRTRAGVGNLETWVRADTNHHIEFVSRQIASCLAV